MVLKTQAQLPVIMASSYYELTNDFLLVSYIPNHFHLKFCHEP